ncbi:MAG: trehalose-6-phosphate synthase [Chloroflexales bacterium]|nr:trehalose-6-phosphate synthase [Chloroflexales bacterium]
MPDQPTRRLITVSNRLPIVLRRAPDHPGGWRAEGGAGGLVSALTPVLRARGGEWIGWAGTVEEDAVDLDQTLAVLSAEIGFTLTPVALTADQRDKFYLGFSNEVIWPLFHDLQSRANFAPSYFAAYEEVNRRFAAVIARRADPDDLVWVHDYHLINTAQELRSLGVTSSLIFFLHIPFPPPDIFLKLPWRAPIFAGMLAYDLLGFLTARDRDNFIACAQQILASELVVESWDDLLILTVDGRQVRLGVFPIGIDAASFERAAATRETTDLTRQLRMAVDGQQIILGVDRLDYTKGIEQRLEAFRHALQRHPELRHRVTLVQIAVPSRTDIPEYRNLKQRIEGLVGEINGEFTHLGWVPIQYIYRSLPFTELLAHFRAADVALITPLKDGMNLVAKEYCAAHLDQQGVLILSEFAGAAAQLGAHALTVNPYDIDGVADAISEGCRMPLIERVARMAALRESVRTHDVFWWADSVLRAGALPVPGTLATTLDEGE